MDVEPEAGPVGGVDEAQAVARHVAAAPPLVNLPDLRVVGAVGGRHAQARLAVGGLGLVAAGGELLGGAVEGVAHDVERRGGGGGGVEGLELPVVRGFGNWLFGKD